MKEISTQEKEARIDPRNEREIAYWAQRLDVPAEEFRRAAQQAGPRLGDIRQHLIGGFTTAGPTS